MLIQMGSWVNSDKRYFPFSDNMENGRFDLVSLEERVRYNANMGVNVFRMLPGMVRDNLTKSLKDAMAYKGNNRNFLQFMWDENAESYDQSKLNQIYFDNQYEAIMICNRKNSYYQAVIGDTCHHRMAEHCFTKNIQGLKYYEWSIYYENYVRKLLETILRAKRDIEAEGFEFKIMFELINEPRVEGYIKTGIEILKLIIEYGFNTNLIELGFEYILNNFMKTGEFKVNPLFTKFKAAMRKEGLYSGENDQGYLFTVHDFANEKKQSEIIKMVGHSFRFKHSNDGEFPVKKSKEFWYKNMLPIFEEMKRKIEKGSQIAKRNKEWWMFEALYNGQLNGESMFGDHIDGIEGLSLAHYKVFGEYPENYGKFPKIEETEEEDMKKIEELETKVQQLVELNNALAIENKTLRDDNTDLKTKKKFVFFRNGFSFKGWNVKGLWKIIDLYVYIAVGSIIAERIIF